MRGNPHVRFGGRAEETDRLKGQHRASARPNHSLACMVLLGWYRDGVDVEAHLPLLSTFLGHGNPSSTYWYLSAVPELLALAAERRDHLRGVRA